MSLLRWMGVSPQAQNRPNAQSQSADKPLGAAPVSSADAKRFGLENLRQLCPSSPLLFRTISRARNQLSRPRISLSPTAPLIVNPVLPTTATASTKPAPKADSKTSTTAGSGHKRPVSGGQYTESHSKTDTEDSSNVVNTGPAISAQPPTLFSALRSLFIHISQHSLDKGTVAPQVFIAKLRKENELFRTTMHQDAHEFLNYLVNSVVENMEEEEKLERQREKAPVEDLSTSIITTTTASQGKSTGTTQSKGTFIHDLFEGTLTSETRCLTCETVSSRDEMFLDLSIDIEQNSSVTACLRQFSASEMLCQRNKFFCDSCCGLQEAEKRMKIKRLPNILALHLKRFKYQEDLNRYVKLNYRVAFPFQLRLFNTVDDAADMDRLYELWAIVVHIGSGPLHGHYITIIKAQGTWLVFDDNSVETIRESDIPKYYGDSGSGTGYVLFYQAVDLDREALGLRPEPTVPISTGIPLDTKIQDGPPSPHVPILVETPLDSTTTDIPLGSPPPSPSVPLTKPYKDTSPIGAPQPLPTPPPIPVSAATSPTTASSTSGGFFSSLRHSRSVKADRTSLTATAPVAALPTAKVNGDANGHVELEKEEKEKTSNGWLTFRTKEKRRDSVSQIAASTAPSSPRMTVASTAPPSPKTSTVIRPLTASSNILEQIPPLPTASLPLPSLPAAAIEGQKIANGDAQPTKRASTADPTLVDGSDSLSGSSSWTSAGINGLVDLRDIPPIPKDLPPVPPLPPLPPNVNTTLMANQATTSSSVPSSAVTSNGVPFTLTQSSSPSTWSVPSISVGGDLAPVEHTNGVLAESSAMGSSSSMATQAQLVPPRPARQSTKDSKDAIKARKAAEAAAKKNKEKLEEEKKRAEKALKEREKMERERLEREREKAEKEHHNNKLANRVSRKMSLGLSGLVGWSSTKDKDKHTAMPTHSIASSSTPSTDIGHHGTKGTSAPVVFKSEVPSGISFNF